MDRNDSFSPGYCEYLVPGFCGKNMNIIRAVGVLLGLVVTAAVCSLLSFMPQVVFIWLVVVLFFEIMLFRMTKREFEYNVAMGEMSVDVIYGKKFRRRLFCVKLSDVDSVFAVSSFNDERVLKASGKKIFASPKKSEYMYCLVTKEIKGERTVVVFSSCNKLCDAIKFYNRGCFNK